MGAGLFIYIKIYNMIRRLIIILFSVICMVAQGQPYRKTIIKAHYRRYDFKDSTIKSALERAIFWPQYLDSTNRYYRINTNFSDNKFITLHEYHEQSGYGKDTTLSFSLHNHFYHNYYTKRIKGYFVVNQRPVLITANRIPFFLTPTDTFSSFSDTIRADETYSKPPKEAVLDDNFLYWSYIADQNPEFYLQYSDGDFVSIGYDFLEQWENQKRPWETIPRLNNIREKLEQKPVKSITTHDGIVRRTNTILNE